MPGVQPYVYIEPPEIDPRPFGLFGAARPLPGIDPHWRYGGVEYEALGCYQAGFYPVGINAAGGAGGTKTLPNGAGTTKAIPFAVYAGISCGSVGYTDEQSAARALRVLELAGQWAAEDALWTGAGGNAPALNAASTTIPTGGGTASSLTNALRILENWIGDAYNGRGFIHGKRGVGVLAGAKRLSHRDPMNADSLLTPVGSRWIFGAGYNGTGPNAVAPAANQTWIYATGQVSITRDAPSTPATRSAILDKATNVVNLIAEQEYLVTYDCAVAAALVDLTL